LSSGEDGLDATLMRIPRDGGHDSMLVALSIPLSSRTPADVAADDFLTAIQSFGFSRQLTSGLAWRLLV
jgi:hypothetical protein